MSNRPRSAGGDPPSLCLVVGLGPRRHHLVDQAPGLGLFGGHEVVPLQRRLDLFIRISRVMHIDLVQPALQFLGLAGVDQDVGRLALIACRTAG